MNARNEREERERVRSRFTRSAEPFAKFALASRTGDADRLVALAAPERHELALDLACGPGTFTLPLAEQARFVHGLDLTPALLEQAQRAVEERRLRNVVLTCGSAYRMPYRDASFDLAGCGYSLHHFAEPARALAELARVLRPGGRVVVLDMIVPARADPARTNAIERARDESHARTLAAAELVGLVESAGLRVRTREFAERPRSFADWMRVAGWAPTDRAWIETCRLMEATVADDAAGFRPRWAQGQAGAKAELEFTQSSVFVLAVKR